MLTFEPLLSLPATLALAACAVGALVGYALRRPAIIGKSTWRRIIACMGLGLFLTFLVLLNPTRLEPLPGPPGKPLLSILIDASASMETPDAGDRRTRFQNATSLAKSIVEAAKKRFDVRLNLFDGQLRTVETTELEQATLGGTTTDLTRALQQTASDFRDAGQMAVVLSDGIHNASDPATVIQAARDAKALALPIWVKTLGGQQDSHDVAVEFRSPTDFVFADRPLTISATLRQRGLAGQTAKVRLKRGPAVLEEKSVKLASAATSDARFEVPPQKPGTYRYEVECDPVEGEVSLLNNSASLLVQVVDQPVRVLLLEGRPYWDSKFLVRTLSSDASIELDSVVRVGEGRLYRRAAVQDRPELGPISPVKSKDLAKGDKAAGWEVFSDFSKALAASKGLKSYQVIVLGRDAEVFLDDATLTDLRDWLSHDGGSLVCARGQPAVQINQRLAAILPLKWTPTKERRIQWNLTDRGKDLGWLAPPESDALPPLASISRPSSPRPLTVVLATATDLGKEGENSAVTFQPYGLGRVVTIEGSGMWRWAFLPPHQRSTDAYEMLWRNLLRWLISNTQLLPGQDMALRSDKFIFSPAEPVMLTLVTRDSSVKKDLPEFELRDERQTVRKLPALPVPGEPGSYRLTFGKLSQGRYSVESLGATKVTTTFDVRQTASESLDLAARPGLMASIARESGGGVIESDDAADAFAKIEQQYDRQHPVQVKRISIWDRWWVLGGILAVWASTWFFRRRHQLI